MYNEYPQHMISSKIKPNSWDDGGPGLRIYDGSGMASQVHINSLNLSLNFKPRFENLKPRFKNFKPRFERKSAH